MVCQGPPLTVPAALVGRQTPKRAVAPIVFLVLEVRRRVHLGGHLPSQLACSYCLVVCGHCRCLHRLLPGRRCCRISDQSTAPEAEKKKGFSHRVAPQLAQYTANLIFHWVNF